ncbi:hypothetical protein CEXT_732461 [Caerostris extrusa]|uniref:Uncharacterized protein n=1 Tax=Caerostris extrusa TaxID=172846 RepID=A0AAV4R1C4_CAEEX|nr:hypothetical protein CEXT_732461 [Caerostris extrusa]
MTETSESGASSANSMCPFLESKSRHMVSTNGKPIPLAGLTRTGHKKNLLMNLIYCPEFEEVVKIAACRLLLFVRPPPERRVQQRESPYFIKSGERYVNQLTEGTLQKYVPSPSPVPPRRSRMSDTWNSIALWFTRTTRECAPQTEPLNCRRNV